MQELEAPLERSTVPLPRQLRSNEREDDARPHGR
jgi:hypothetical protein